jgi:hypothetical protein
MLADTTDTGRHYSYDTCCASIKRKSVIFVREKLRVTKLYSETKHILYLIHFFAMSYEFRDN